MTKRSRKIRKSQAELPEFIVVAFAEDMEQAKEYEALLKSNDIPAIVKEQDDPRSDGVKSITVMVPEEFIDEAHVVVESQDAYDDFYDLTSEEEDSDFDSELLDNDF